MAKANVPDGAANGCKSSTLKTFLVTIDTGHREMRQALFADKDGFMDAIRRSAELRKTGIEALVFFHGQEADALAWIEMGSSFNLLKSCAQSIEEVPHA